MTHSRAINASAAPRAGIFSMGLGRVRQGGGAAVPTFLAAPAPATAFGQRNGDTAGTSVAQRWFSGPTLTNVFGDRNNANTAGGMLPGLLAIRLMHLPGNAVASGTTSSGINQSQQPFGTATSLSARSIRCTWYGTQSGSTAFQDRYVWAGQFSDGASFGDIDPITGAGGSGNAIRGLRSGVVDPYRTEPVMLFLRMNAAGRLQVFHAYADGTLVAGDFFDHAATAGIATANAGMSFGRAGVGATYQASWSGSMSDFIQVNNLDVSDAQLSALARGENPATVLASLHAFYRMGGPTDLVLTAGTSGYAALTLTDTASQCRRGAARPSTASGRTVHLLPEFDGFVHALSPTAVRAAASRAAVKALTASCVMRVRIAGSGSTHIWGRIRRSSDDVVLVDWTRLTSSPVAAGEHELTLPGVPVAVDFYREVGAEDGLCTSADFERHRAGIVAAVIGQSQQTIMLANAATGADTATGNGLVSFIAPFGAYMTTISLTACAGARLDRPGMYGPAVYELAKHWQDNADGIPLMIVGLSRGGTGRDTWMSGAEANLWINSTAPSSGSIPAAVFAARRRFTMFLENWCTSDQSAINSGQLPALNDELYLGIGSSGGRVNFSQFPLVQPVWVSGVPFTRHRNITAAVPTEANRNSFETARSIMRTYYNGTGGSPSIVRDVGAYMTALALGPIGEGPHQRTDELRGNVYYARWTAMALARMAKLYTADIEGTFTAASRSGAVITVTANLPNAGTLQTIVDNQTPVGFEVSEDGGATWSRSNGTIPFTPARSGNTVTLTRGSGNWTAGTQVRYLFGYPWDIPPGNDVTAFGLETTDIDNMAAEVLASVPLGKLPLRPTLGALVAA